MEKAQPLSPPGTSGHEADTEECHTLNKGTRSNKSKLQSVCIAKGTAAGRKDTYNLRQANSGKEDGAEVKEELTCSLCNLYQQSHYSLITAIV